MAPSALFSTCARNVHAWAGGDCLLCGAESAPELLCAACIGELPALPESCPQCALPSRAAAVCGSCINRPPHFDATLALWRYEFPCDTLVQALKYRARLALAGFFARSLASRPLPEVDVVLPMPLHPKRLAERGFNQALEIARGLARNLGRILPGYWERWSAYFMVEVPMHRVNVVAVVTIVVLAVLAGFAFPAAAQAVTAFEGARLIVGDGRVIENAALMVDGTKIAQAGKAADVRVPAGATRVNVAGKTVMPMVIDRQVHPAPTPAAVV